jgi:signal transduction histidine kinase
MSVELELELRSLKHGDHACLLFDGASEADNWEAIVPFFKEGLSRGERCHLLLSAADQRATAMQMLSAAGVSSELEVQRGALTFVELQPGSFAPGRLNPRALLRGTRGWVSQASADGFSGLRLCNAAPWFPPGEVVDERAWIEFESLLSDAGSSWNVILLCRHDLRRSQPAFLREVLHVHPKAILGPLVCPCTYYEPARMILGKASEEDRLHWMIDQLSNARLEQRALERAVQARDEFLSAASHEFRTPLAAALLDLENVMRAAEAGPEEQVAKCSIFPKLQRMKGDFHRFVEIVQGLVDASALRGEHVEFHLEPVDLREATRSALEHCADELRRSRCDVNLTTPDESVLGQWDRMRIEELVTNLVENAAKFGRSKPIDVTVSRSDGTARLVVRDHGIGVRPEDVPRIFERFERGVPLSHYGGFGLGLWIADTIVDAFGGHIDVSSEPGAGTTFTVDLPMRV